MSLTTDQISITLIACVDCKTTLDLEDAAATQCPFCESSNLVSNQTTLAHLIEVYEAATREMAPFKAAVDEAGSIEIACPSCTQAVIISDLETCVCGATCCCECASRDEDVTACPACVKLWNEVPVAVADRG